jgi:acyl dehydratase
MKPTGLPFDDISLGQTASFQHIITEDEVNRFAELSGDYNPLHVDAGYAAKVQFGRRIVHGMFLGALISRLVGMHLPGRRCLYLSQSLNFSLPVFIGEMVEVVGKVGYKQESEKILIVETNVYKLPSNSAAVRGTATVKVLDDPVD